MFTQRNQLRSHQGLFARLVIWAAAEVLLNYVGIDDLADYSEFLFEKPIAAISQIYDIG